MDYKELKRFGQIATDPDCGFFPHRATCPDYREPTRQEIDAQIKHSEYLDSLKLPSKVAH